MKLLMFLAKQFTFRPFEKTLLDASRGDGGGEVHVPDAAVIFVHAEPQDEADTAGLETKFVRNVKWIAGKRGLKNHDARLHPRQGQTTWAVRDASRLISIRSIHAGA